MPVTADKPAPYAPAAAILDVLNRNRQKGLPGPVNPDLLGRIGISDSLNSRVLYALIALDLIDDGGTPTPTMEALRLAPEAEYKKSLENWLKSAYADIFAFVDPATDDETRIRDAFRSYTPVGQQARMVTLFLGLCAAAGLIQERPVSTTRPRAAAARPSRTASASRAPARQLPRGPAIKLTRSPSTGSSLPPALSGLLESLPDPTDGWTAQDRDKFLTTFKAVLDFCIPVGKARPTNENDGHE